MAKKVRRLGYQGLVAELFGNPTLATFEFSSGHRTRLAEICEEFISEMAVVDPRRSIVIRRGFGIPPHPQTTLQNIANDLDCCRENVRRIEGIVLRAFKHPKWSRTLHILFQQAGVPDYPEEPVSVHTIPVLKWDMQHGRRLSPEELSQIGLKDLNLNERIIQCFISARITSLADIATRTKAELLRIQNFSNRLLPQLEKAIAEFGVVLKDA